MTGCLYLIFAVIALLFLSYSMLNLDKLRITFWHPRVLVELAVFATFFTLGLFNLNC